MSNDSNMAVAQHDWLTWLLGFIEIKSRIMYIWKRNVDQTYSKGISLFKWIDTENVQGL